MSIKVMARVWDESRLKGSELLLLLAIADFANDEGKAWPKVSTLAHKTRMSERQTQRLIQSAEESGELVVHKNQGPRGTNLYEVMSPRQDVTPTSTSPGGDTDDTSRGDIAVSPEPSLDPSLDPSVGQMPIQPKDIVNVWAEVCNGGAWPVNKGPALRAAKTLVDGGITPDDARSLIAWMQADDFWGKKAGIDLGKMVKAADAWRSRQSAAQAKRERLVY